MGVSLGAQRAIIESPLGFLRFARIVREGQPLTTGMKIKLN